jgi:hypothetical protein
MSNQRQIITAIQKGPIVDFEVEIESPMGEGLFLPGVALYEMMKGEKGVGVSVRVMKGLWFHQGGSKGQDELTKIDEGYITITGRNITFAGGSNTITIPLNKIVRIQPYTDGLGVYKEGRQKEFRFVWGKNIDMKLVNVKDDDGKIKPLSGSIINTFIVALRKQGKLMN